MNVIKTRRLRDQERVETEKVAKQERKQREKENKAKEREGVLWRQRVRNPTKE